MTDALLELVASGIRIIDLGRPLFTGMPQSADHPQFRIALVRRHGDLIRNDGSSGSNEVMITGGHVGTHIDALSHISFDGRLHGGVDTREAERGGRFGQMGAETIAPIVARGLLLDVPAATGEQYCPPGEEIPISDLERALERIGESPRKGDVLLIRTGWGRLWGERSRYEGLETGTPGVGPAAAEWLAGFGPRAVGSDTIAFERLTPSSRPVGLPVHKILIVDHGIHLIETLNLEQLAAIEATAFTFVLAPLPIVGATGAPARPLALLAQGD